MVICLDRGANDLNMVQLMPLSSHHLLLQYTPVSQVRSSHTTAGLETEQAAFYTAPWTHTGPYCTDLIQPLPNYGLTSNISSVTFLQTNTVSWLY